MELRDSISVIFCAQEQIESLLKKESDEVLIKYGKIESVKDSQPPFGKLTSMIIMNVLFFVGITFYNLNQVKIIGNYKVWKEV